MFQIQVQSHLIMLSPNSEPSLLPVTIVATCLEGVFYGVFLTLFTLSTYLLVMKRPDGRSYPRMMHYASLFIFFFTTAHWINSAVRMAQSLFSYTDTQISMMALGDLQPSGRLKSDLVMILMIIGNFTIVYRLWVIHNYEKRVVLLPFTALLGLFLFSVVIFIEGFTSLRDLQSTKHHEVVTAVGVYFSTICINIYSVALVSWKVCKAEDPSKTLGNSRFDLIAAILIDNLVLFSMSSTFYFISFITGSNAAPLADAISAPVIGIAFMLMNFRVWLGWVRDGPGSGHVKFDSSDLLPKWGHGEEGGESLPAVQGSNA
ncbi:hypothetical protein BD779DRAFT_1537001 [Infundibulicybe gibba]|nr:hypothetical protein BD779DRAFT_1537001 [Infundibulicybe gibba]